MVAGTAGTSLTTYSHKYSTAAATSLYLIIIHYIYSLVARFVVAIIPRWPLLPWHSDPKKMMYT